MKVQHNGNVKNKQREQTMRVIVDKAQSGKDVVISILRGNIILQQTIVDNLPEEDGIVIYTDCHAIKDVKII